MIIKNFIDRNTYKHIVLSNNLKVVLVSNKEFNKASCALSVNIGSYNDPDEIQGLAHFLEHMLFMGTEKYPAENGFNEFLSQHGGYTNAYTISEMTVYYCDVDHTQIKTMSSMFSSFFSCPLFFKDSVKREMNAVNSEYLDTLNNKDFRMEALLTEFTIKNDVRGRFTCGNLETLNQKGIWDKLVKFWKDNYSADGMCLVICGSNEIEELEELAQYFAEIPNRNYFQKINTLRFLNHCHFDPKYLGNIIHMAALDDKKELVVCLSIPPTLCHYKKNPLSYIDFILTEKGKGSLLSQFKTKKLAFNLSINWEYYMESTGIKISIELTNKGRQEYVEVLSMLIDSIKNLPVQHYEYERLRRIQEEEFRYKQSDLPMDLAEQLAFDMQRYSIENLLNHNYVFESFDEPLIRNIVSELADYKSWIILLLDKEGTFENKENFYSVEYSNLGVFEPRATDCAEHNEMVEQPYDFAAEALKRSDEYLESIDLVTASKDRFSQVHHFSNGKISYVYDQKLKVPQAEIYIFLKNRFILQNYIKYKVFLTLAEDSFIEKYSRSLTNFHLDFSTLVNHEGVLLKFEGFTANIIKACKLFFDHIKSLKMDRFDVVKKELEDYYSENIVLSPYERLTEMFSKNILGSKISEECLELLKELKRDDVCFLDDYYLEILAVGNLEFEPVKDLFEYLQKSAAEPTVTYAQGSNFVEFKRMISLISLPVYYTSYAIMMV